jgi:putative protease
MKNNKLPELLSPAGSPEAFRAAIDGGADAIYVGGASFNARINAKNFTVDDLRDAVKLAHLYGVKVYQTVNIMLFGRELDEFLRSAEESARLGMDAFIVSDLGAAALLRKYLPEIPLHGSTQISVHNSSGARMLASLGFSRVVPARELTKGDIRTIVEESSLEVETFIHGAMCVSHSGQCLFSSLVGGRSGNRGLCAQPCRMPYACDGGRVSEAYPLSLKDMSLSDHVREIIDSGVSSLKIEGRMKSPEYVRGVTAIWRRLLDEGRNAEREEKTRLSELFSRGGFTDGYYTGNIGRRMLGVRSEEDKQASRGVEKFNKIERKLPVKATVTLTESAPASLMLTYKDKTVQVEGDIPQVAINAPIDEVTVKKCVSKLGDSSFVLEDADISIDGRLMMPVSQLNALRRSGVEALERVLTGTERDISIGKIEYSMPQSRAKRRNIGRFYSVEQISQKAREFFDVVLLPLDKFAEVGELADGFFMPAIVFDSEKERIEGLLAKATAKAPKYAVVSNIGQLEMLKKQLPHTALIADFRFNVGNSENMAVLENLGFESVVVSAELTLPQIRDLDGAKAAIVYGRIPLMTLEKCVICELYGDKGAKKGAQEGKPGQYPACRICNRGEARMKDRRGFVFPIIRELPHRNVILNSLPTHMSDRQNELSRAGVVDRHFLFTVETPDEVDGVIFAFEQNLAPDGKVRRI